MTDAITTGLLWFDDDPRRPLEEKVQRATAYYHRKYGRAPDLCLVHSSALDGNGKVVTVDSLTVRAGRSILPHHFWLGVARRREQHQAK